MSSSFDSSVLGQSHIALAPTIGAGSRGFKRFDTSDVDRIGDGANTKTYSSIRIDLQDGVRPTVGRFILILGTLPEHNLIVDAIGMRDARFIFVFIVFLD